MIRRWCGRHPFYLRWLSLPSFSLSLPTPSAAPPLPTTPLLAAPPFADDTVASPYTSEGGWCCGGSVFFVGISCGSMHPGRTVVVPWASLLLEPLSPWASSPIRRASFSRSSMSPRLHIAAGPRQRNPTSPSPLPMTAMTSRAATPSPLPGKLFFNRHHCRV